MRLEKFEVLADCRQNLVIFRLLRGVLSNMQDVGLLIAHYFCLLRLLLLRFLLLLLIFLGDRVDQGLILGVFVDFVSDLGYDVVDLVAEFNDQILTLQTEVLFGPYQLKINLETFRYYLTQSNMVLYSLMYSLLYFPLYR